MQNFRVLKSFGVLATGTIIFFLASNPTLAAESSGTFEGSISFSAEEVVLHQKEISKLVAVSSKCIRKTYDSHAEFYSKWGISPFYGDNSEFSRMDLRKQKSYLSSLGVPENFVYELRPTSCIGLAYRCFKEGFEATGQSNIWKTIFDFTQKNGGDGLATQFALQKLGWKIYFWNPDLSKNQIWDNEEMLDDPRNQERFWGYHAYRYQTVKGKTHQYLYNPVDDDKALVGFNRSVPSILASSNFYIGVAHGGYHVFLGLNERIVEAHSTRDISDRNLLEDNRFDPLNPVTAGPSGKYRSGLIALPPIALKSAVSIKQLRKHSILQ